MKIRQLSKIEADSLLNSIGMKIGNWNQITERNDNKLESIIESAPANGLQLYCFAAYIAGWLPKGQWKLFQLDNSQGFSAYDAFFFGRLLFGSAQIPNLNLSGNSTFLFEFGQGHDVDNDTELLITNLIYVFLLFQGNGQIISSGSLNKQYLSLRDSVVYFVSKDKAKTGAVDLLKNYQNDQSSFPQWIMDIVAERQEREVELAEKNNSTS
jgi:hypothetical protein